MGYKIAFKKSVTRDLKNIERADAIKILDKIENELALKADELPQLRGQFAGLKKYRIGDYRVIFTIIKDTVLILRIRHRKDVYKK